MSRTNFYSVWRGMFNRCENKNHKQFPAYGGRGIKICDKWSQFENFYDDMFPTYRVGLSLDRIDNNGAYSKKNCRWATRSIQNTNKRNTVFTVVNGVRVPLARIEKARSAKYQRRYREDKKRNLINKLQGKKV
jgi:hypothetical protein